MAIYRNVQLSFWTDSKISDEFTPEDKFFYLYLLTNPHTTICGCYEISIRQMSIETGYSKETIQKLIDRMEKVHNVIRYSINTKEVLILNWSKYNWSQSPLVQKSIQSSINKLKTPEFKAFITNRFNGIDTVSIEYQNTIQSTFSLVSDSLVSNDENEKSKEHQKEVDELFETIWKLYIRKEGKNQVTKAAKEEIFDVGYDRMKACIERYAKEKQGTEKKFLLMGSTFFNGRYKDYLVEETKPVEEAITDQDEEWSDEDFFKAVDSGFGEG